MPAVPNAAASPRVIADALRKEFGSKTALEHVTFSINAGEIVGLVGPNGAGKTTLLRLLTGVLEPTSGRAWVCGFDASADPIEVKRRIGFVPESNAVFESLSALEYLEIVAQLQGIAPALARERIFRLTELFDLEASIVANQLLGAYSKGMRRKVIIASALLHNPAVLFFDEPLDGLDPAAALAFKILIRRLADEGKAILYSSHLLDVVERVCDRVIVLNQGAVVLDGRPADLLGSAKSPTLERLFAQITGDTASNERASFAADALTRDQAPSAGP